MNMPSRTPFAPSISVLKIWMILASQYVGAQVGIRALSAAGALLLVNVLPVEEYGVYTLLLASLTFLTGASDFGATASLMYFWRRAKKRARVFDAYLLAVLRLRRTLFLASAVASVLYLATLTALKKYDVGSLMIGTALMLGATWYLIRVGTTLGVLRLQGRFVPSYLIELAGEATKLCAIVAIWFFGVRSATGGMAAMLAGALASASVSAQMTVLRTVCHVGKHTRSVKRRIHSAVRQQVLPTAPWTLFFAMQTPLLAWLAAAFGSAQNLGEVGALGRVASIIGLAAGFTVSVLIPRLNNVSDERAYFRYYVYWWFVLISLGIALAVSVYAWPGALLWLIGPQYKGLRSELLISVMAAMVMTCEWYAGAINRARGWVSGQLYRILFVLLGQIAMFPSLDFSRTADLLTFSLGSAILMLVTQVAQNLLGFVRTRSISMPKQEVSA